MTNQERIEHHEPERYDGYQQRRQSAGDIELSIGKRQIAAHQQQKPNNCELQQLAGVITNLLSASGAVRQHDEPGNGETRAAHERWRNVLNGYVDSQIGRAPQYVDQPKVEGQRVTGWLDGTH